MSAPARDDTDDVDFVRECGTDLSEATAAIEDALDADPPDWREAGERLRVVERDAAFLAGQVRKLASEDISAILDTPLPAPGGKGLDWGPYSVYALGETRRRLFVLEWLAILVGILESFETREEFDRFARAVAQGRAAYGWKKRPWYGMTRDDPAQPDYFWAQLEGMVQSFVAADRPEDTDYPGRRKPA
jgi:hypothetical protein